MAIANMPEYNGNIERVKDSVNDYNRCAKIYNNHVYNKKGHKIRSTLVYQLLERLSVTYSQIIENSTDYWFYSSDKITDCENSLKSLIDEMGGRNFYYPSSLTELLDQFNWQQALNRESKERNEAPEEPAINLNQDNSPGKDNSKKGGCCA